MKELVVITVVVLVMGSGFTSFFRSAVESQASKIFETSGSGFDAKFTPAR